jgi:hypothetical protein
VAEKLMKSEKLLHADSVVMLRKDLILDLMGDQGLEE